MLLSPQNLIFQVNHCYLMFSAAVVAPEAHSTMVTAEGRGGNFPTLLAPDPIHWELRALPAPALPREGIFGGKLDTWSCALSPFVTEPSQPSGTGMCPPPTSAGCRWQMPRNWAAPFIYKLQESRAAFPSLRDFHLPGSQIPTRAALLPGLDSVSLPAAGAAPVFNRAFLDYSK